MCKSMAIPFNSKRVDRNINHRKVLKSLAVFNKKVEANAKMPTATNKVLQNVMQGQVGIKASQHSKKFQVLQALVSSNGKMGDKKTNDHHAKKGTILETIMNAQYETEETSWHQISQKG